MADVKFFEGYSRYSTDLGRYETWAESVARVMDMHRMFYADRIAKHPELAELITEAQIAYTYKHVLGAQRALQFGGAQLLAHHMRLYNCTSSYADRPAFFGEYFYILLCGAGAGFSVQKHHVVKLPMIRPRTKQAKTHVIEDSIEGWATALDVLMASFFMGGGKHPEYEGRKIYFDLNAIRPKGAPISGGFKAPGPDPLAKALSYIERLLTERAEDGVLKPITVYDVCMHAADAVLAGGVRRAATICLFSPDDEEMIGAKTGDWFMTNKQRARSNNSAVLVRDKVTREQFANIIKSTRQFGEPGFIFAESTEHTYNPCVEIGMYPVLEDGSTGWQGCNLTEINGMHCTTKEQFHDICHQAAILGTLQAGYTDFKFVDSVTKKIFDREALLGCSITGWMNNPDVLFDAKTLREGAKIIRETNRMVAKLLGINPAARTTCVKPSGNASVLLGSASGIHPEPAKRFIRNVQIAKNQEVARVLFKANPYMLEESVWSEARNDYAISFPVIPPKTSLYKRDFSGIDLLEKVKLVQQNWVEHGTDLDLCIDKTSRHNVSNTITVKADEWDSIEEYIYTNRKFFAGIALLNESGDKDYYQAPNTEVPYAKDIVKEYGDGAIFASGLIVDSSRGFSNLWEAISVAKDNHDQSNQELRDTRADWVRRFHKFADTFFAGDMEKTGYCLKDVYVLHKWNKIQANYQAINLEEHLKEIKLIDADTMAAAACAAGECLI